MAIGAVAGSTFKFDVTGATGNVANFQADAGGGTAAIFVVEIQVQQEHLLLFN